MNNRKKWAWQLPFLLALIVGTIFIVRQQQNTPYQKDEGYIFGTVYHITYQHSDNLKEQIEQQLMEVNRSLSTFDPNSIISQVNQNKNPKVDRMFTEVFTLSERIAKETNGAFDITVAPLVNLWGFGFKKGQTPSPQAIDSLRATVGFHKVKLVNQHVKKSDPRTMLDCSAIAKGYGCDVVARYLRSQGVKNFMVEIGGEIVTSGISPKRMPWKIGVTKPTDDPSQQSNEVEAIINVTDKAMATSGNYRNFYYKNGRKYAHTIDPKTGRPVQHNILSATVLADDCATADAYATAFMVEGLQGAQRVLAHHPELMVYLIYSDAKGHNKVWYSPAMREKISH